MPDTVTLVVKESGDTFASHLYVGEKTVATNRARSPEATQAQRTLAADYLGWFDAPGVPLVEEATLAEMGEHLFETWLADDWDDVQDALTPPGRSRFVVASDVPAVLNLPWSLLRLPGRDEPLGLEPTTSVRLHPAADRLAEGDGERRPGPLRVLYSACAPRDAGDLGYEKEEYQLLQTLTQPDADVAHFGCDLGRFDELQDRVREYNPHVVHLTGHGVVTDGKAYFAFEDEEGESDLRLGDQIVPDALAGRGVQCVFVSGCETGQAPEVRAVNGLCQGLVRNGVPAAVGWTASILDDVATKFGDTFYAELSAGEDVDRAVVQARRDARALCRERVDEDGVVDPSWTLPVLYTATTQADLFDPSEEEPPPKPSVAQDPLPGMTEGHAAYFIGRRREQQRLLPTLRSGDLNTVLLTGLGGVGKSTLATRLARRLQPDGFVPIAVPSTDDDPLTAGRLIDRCFEAFLAEDADGPYPQLRSEDIGLRDKLRLLVRLFNQNRFTLVLDNFEQNVDRASHEILDDTLAWFLPYLVENLTGDSRCLVTSRYRPANLGDDLPPVATELSLTDFPESAFFKYLLADETVEQRYRFGDLPRDLLSRVYDLLGGTPRFLEQVREALGEMPADELADALDDVDLPADADAEENRLRDLRDAYVQDLFVDQLYAAIEPPEARAALSRAAVYTIPMTAEGYAAAADADENTVRDWLDEWRRRTFVAPVQSDDADGALWVIPPLLRPWLLKQMDEDECKEAHRAAGNWLLEIYDMDRVEEDLGRHFLAVGLEARSCFLSSENYERARQITDHLSKHLIDRASYESIIQLNKELLDCLKHPSSINWIGRAYDSLADYDEAERWHRRAIEVASEDFPSEYARALHGVGAAMVSKGNIEEGQDFLARAISSRKEIGNYPGEALSRQILASSFTIQGNYEEARNQYMEAQELAREAGNVRLKTTIRKEVASLELEQGNFEKAREEHRAVLDTARRIGDRRMEAQALHQLGYGHLSQDRFKEARDRFRQAFDVCSEIREELGAAKALHQIASIDYRNGKLAEARQKIEAVLEKFETIGAKREKGAALHDLALIDMEKGKLDSARQGLIEALFLRQEVEDYSGEATTLTNLGTLACRIQPGRKALALLMLGYTLLRQVEHHDAEKLGLQTVLRLLLQGEDLLKENDSLSELEGKAIKRHAQDRGWSLIQEAFPDADLPDDVPPSGNSE